KPLSKQAQLSFQVKQPIQSDQSKQNDQHRIIPKVQSKHADRHQIIPKVQSKDSDQLIPKVPNPKSKRQVKDPVVDPAVLEAIPMRTKPKKQSFPKRQVKDPVVDPAVLEAIPLRTRPKKQSSPKRQHILPLQGNVQAREKIKQWLNEHKRHNPKLQRALLLY